MIIEAKLLVVTATKTWGKNNAVTVQSLVSYAWPLKLMNQGEKNTGRLAQLVRASC